MTIITIEKGVPMPKNGAGRHSIYPFAQMEIGDSFAVPNDMGEFPSRTSRRQKTISGSAASWAKRHNPAAKFATHVIDGNTVRCWRVA